MYRPKEITEQLGISSATLRRWSDTFADHLSPTAGKSLTDQGGSAQRRYTDGDVLVLTRVKQLLDAGHTYEETARKLDDVLASPDSAHSESTHLGSASSAVALTEPRMSDATIALEAFRETIASKDQTITAQQETIAAQRHALVRAEELTAELRALTEHQRTMLSKAAAATERESKMTLLQRIDGLLRGRMIGA